MAKRLHYEQVTFFVYVRDTKKQVIKVFYHNEEGIIGNAKDMKKEILDIENDACVEIPNFIPFWTMKYFSFQSWIVIYVFFCNNFFVFFYFRGACEVFNFTNGGQWEWPIWKK